MRIQARQIARCLVGAVFGALPGLVLTLLLTNHRIGVAVTGIGALVGAVLTLPGVSIGRTVRLLINTLVAYNVPGYDETVDPEAGDDSRSTINDSVAASFTDWIGASDIVHRRRFVVFAGMVVGLLAGIVIAVHDLWQLRVDATGWVLPFRHSRDSHFVQGMLLCFAVAVWTGSAAGILFAPAFRRPILFAIAFAGFLSGMVGYAVADSNGPGPMVFVVLFSTAAAAFAILFASLIEC